MAIKVGDLVKLRPIAVRHSHYNAGRGPFKVVGVRRYRTIAHITLKIFPNTMATFDSSYVTFVRREKSKKRQNFQTLTLEEKVDLALKLLRQLKEKKSNA